MGLVLQYKFSAMLPGVSKKIKGCNASLGPDKWHLGWLASDFSQYNLDLHVVQTKTGNTTAESYHDSWVIVQVEECKYTPCCLVCSQDCSLLGDTSGPEDSEQGLGS